MNVLGVKGGGGTQDSPPGKDGRRGCVGETWELGAGGKTQVNDCQVERCQLSHHLLRAYPVLGFSL